MDIDLEAYAIHPKDLESFLDQDPDLSRLKHMPFVYEPALLKKLPFASVGFYTLTGGVLTGKTTLLKLWIAKLLIQGVPAHAISYLSAKLFTHADNLFSILKTLLQNSTQPIQYILIDDLTMLYNWEKIIKFLAEPNLLNNTTLVITSANKAIPDIIAKYIPDRLHTKEFDFVLYPLAFSECISLKYPNKDLREIDVFKEFSNYLVHGGYLTAINDVAKYGTIRTQTLKSYSTAVANLMSYYGKQETYLYEILSALLTHYFQPISWNMLLKDVSIDHPQTISDYINLLKIFDTIFIQYALTETTLHAAPKKARRILFTDPFIHHAIKFLTSCTLKRNSENELKSSLDDKVTCTRMVKAVTVSHYRRFYPTYYIKAEGEIDIAYINDNRIFPIAITWNNVLRPKDLKQLLKYSNSKILTKDFHSELIENIRTEPLPQALCKLGNIAKTEK